MKAITNNQVLCTQCEEMVHRYAVRCPYCNKTLDNPPEVQNPQMSVLDTQVKDTVSSESKITQMPKQSFVDASTSTASRNPFPFVVSEDAGTEPEQTLFSKDVLAICIPLLTLLTGSFFFFFGIIIKLFSKNGVFLLEWKADSWPYYVFPSFILLAIGFIYLSRTENET